jgi:hypothetical protein
LFLQGGQFGFGKIDAVFEFGSLMVEVLEGDRQLVALLPDFRDFSACCGSRPLNLVYAVSGLLVLWGRAAKGAVTIAAEA